MWQYLDWTCCNVVLCRFTWNMPNSAAITRYIRQEQSLSFARETPTIDIKKRHFPKLVMAREGRKEKAEKIKREWLACAPKVANITQFVIVHTPQWCVGRNFCGYLILRFFPNRKNSQNIVPANNSNNKVYPQNGGQAAVADAWAVHGIWWIRQTREGEAATIRATSKGRRRSIFCTTGLLHFWRNGPSRRVDLQAVGKPALREIGPELLCNGECRAVSSIVCASAFGHHCSPWITPAAS